MGQLFWRIFIAFWLAMAVAAASTGTAVWWYRQSLQPTDRELAVGPPYRLMTIMAAETLRHGGVDALRQWMTDTRSQGARVPLLVVNENGEDLLARPVPGAALLRARELAAEPLDHLVAVRAANSPDGKSYLLFVPIQAQPRRLVQPLPVWLWMLIAIGTVTCLAFSALLAWYLAHPIRKLRWAFDAAAGGRLETRVRPLMGRRHDEIADLGSDFDRMAQQLQALVSAQQRLLHDVSHELRSPLARLQAAIGLLRQNPNKLEPSLEHIEREAARLSELVGEVLTLARLESGSRSPAPENINLADLVANVAEDARFEAQAVGRKIRLDLVGEPHVTGRPELLHRAVENVVRNAIKYTDEGTTVEIALRVQDDQRYAILSVTDRGSGVPPEELDRIFEPFYRTRTGDPVQGFGLGLAIARRAIEAHGGSIRAANLDGAGLRIEMRLPLGSRS